MTSASGVTLDHTKLDAKPVGSPPGYYPSRLLIVVNWSVNWFA